MRREIKVETVIMKPEDRMVSVSFYLADQQVGGRITFDAYVLPFYFAKHLFLYVGDMRYQFIG